MSNIKYDTGYKPDPFDIPVVGRVEIVTVGVMTDPHTTSHKVISQNHYYVKLVTKAFATFY